MKEIKIKEINLSNNSPMTIIAGLNVLEDEDMALDVAEKLKEITTKHNIPFVFKASFDKANRSSIDSYRGPGLEAGKKIFESIKKNISVPIITDIHEEGQIEEISQVVDILQIPAFLCRQTDLISAACKTHFLSISKKDNFYLPIK